jgi:DNA-binding MarR family transcriptional regulator
MRPSFTAPTQPVRTDAGDAFTDIVFAIFRLDGRLMDSDQRLARAGNLTATEWCVLGGVIDQPRSVAQVGRLMGMTRQGVQRVADHLVDRGLAEYQHNPDHRRAKLFACTHAGLWAIRQIALVVHPGPIRSQPRSRLLNFVRPSTHSRKVAQALDTNQADTNAPTLRD